jgi:F-type H+-transporting ATPase subunit c
MRDKAQSAVSAQNLYGVGIVFNHAKFFVGELFMNKFLYSLIALAVSSQAFAEEASSSAASGFSGSGLKFIAAALAIGLAALGGTAAQGKAAASAYEAIGRNPQAADKIQTPLILGLALIEFQTIMAFIIAILTVNS